MSLLDSLKEHLDPKTIGNLAGKLGIDPAKAESAVATALPTILGALAKNSSQPDGADKLDKALAKDHDGSVLAQLQAAGPQLLESGQKILGHVFGGKKQAAVDGVAQKSGLPIDEIAKLLGTVAPIVLGVIGKKKKEENLDASGVASALAADQDKAKAESGGILSMLDADGDGSVMDDLAKHAGALGALFGGGGDKKAS